MGGSRQTRWPPAPRSPSQPVVTGRHGSGAAPPVRERRPRGGPTDIPAAKRSPATGWKSRAVWTAWSSATTLSEVGHGNGTTLGNDDAFSGAAIVQYRGAQVAVGRGRYSLWTGDVGLAIYLWDCIAGEPSFSDDRCVLTRTRRHVRAQDGWSAAKPIIHSHTAMVSLRSTHPALQGCVCLERLAADQ